jgi:hypothetical protein
MRARPFIVLPIVLALSACAAVQPVKSALHLSKPKPDPKPTHTFPAPPVTPSSVSN